MFAHPLYGELIIKSWFIISLLALKGQDFKAGYFQLSFVLRYKKGCKIDILTSTAYYFEALVEISLPYFYPPSSSLENSLFVACFIKGIQDKNSVA